MIRQTTRSDTYLMTLRMEEVDAVLPLVRKALSTANKIYAAYSARQGQAFRFTEYENTATTITDFVIGRLMRVLNKQVAKRKLTVESFLKDYSLEPLSGFSRKRSRFQLKVYYRLGEDNPDAHLYRKGGIYYRQYGVVNVKREHGTSADLYVNLVTRG